jgi:hypothetical protein
MLLRVLGLNPANALQHPGYYYYAAAQATERRRAQFLAMLHTAESNGINFPGFANEKKVDHFGIAVEVRSLIRMYDTEYRMQRSCTPRRTSFSRSTLRCPTDTARDD